MSSIPGNDGPYRDLVDEIMVSKTKTEDHRPVTSSARIFDSLVDSNLELVKTMKAGMKAGIIFIAAFAIIASAMMTTAIFIVQATQADTRDLITAITKKHCP